MAQPTPHGVLLIDKPAGITSFDVIRRLRRVLKTRKIGHAGTLDPFATGLLVLCIGDYTRFAGYLTDDDKRYLATMELGVETNTDDCEGEAVREVPPPEDWAATLNQVLPRFRGTISQVPPAYSAIHVDGQRAYALARKGEDVHIPAREITIHKIDVVQTHERTCVLDVTASKGTYIRALARDLGQALESAAHLSALRRLQSGAFHIDEASTLESIDVRIAQGIQIPLLTGHEALRGFAQLRLTEEQIESLEHGKQLPMPQNQPLGIYAGYAVGESRLIGLLEVVEETHEEDPAQTANADDRVRLLKVKRLLPTT